MSLKIVFFYDRWLIITQKTNGLLWLDGKKNSSHAQKITRIYLNAFSSNIIPEKKKYL